MRFHLLAQTTALAFALPTALATVLSDGRSSGQRKIAALPNDWQLQSSGYASLNDPNDCPASLNMGANCVTLKLQGSGQLDKPSPGQVGDRQRNEIASQGSKAAGRIVYNWKYRGDDIHNSGANFFHIGSVLSGDNVGQFRLTLRGGDVAFENPSASSASIYCDPIDGGSGGRTSVWNLERTLSINLEIVHGVQDGTVDWTIADGIHVLLRCTAYNVFVPVGTYVKTGIYRSMDGAPLDPVGAWVGDYNAAPASANSVSSFSESKLSTSSARKSAGSEVKAGQSLVLGRAQSGSNKKASKPAGKTNK